MDLPVLSAVYLPMLIAAQQAHWDAAKEPWIMAAQIERETCITLKHARCWSPLAELKTSRENGIGLGQVTRAYNADGSIRFDKQAELRAQHRELADWTWARRYEPRPQLTALVLMDRTGHARFRKLAATERDAWSMTLAGYNGGDGAVLKDRLLCQRVAGCDPTRWAGNVALHSTKSRTKWQGYGQSAYDINRGYVTAVLKRAPDYRAAWESWTWKK